MQNRSGVASDVRGETLSSETLDFVHADEDRSLRMFRCMSLCRAFDKAAYDLFLENLVQGSIHLSIGQEAIAAAFGEALEADDWVLHTYRGHAHLIAKGASVFGMMAELLGRESGLHGGKSGSMHLSDRRRGSLGSYAIVGAHLPVAAGAAWASRIRGDERVTVCFFGDGATNIGAFHEALNLAAVWHLPVVYVCENNHYMEYTPIRAVTAVERPAADRASAYGLERVVVDGNDVEAVYSVAIEAAEACRNGNGPVLMEADTYRHGGHSRHDDGSYRPTEEVQGWLARDPIPAYRAVLLRKGLNSAILDDIEDEARALIADAVGRARSAPPADPARAEEKVWGSEVPSW